MSDVSVDGREEGLMSEFSYTNLILTAKEKALNGEKLDRESIIALLEIDPDSIDADMLGMAAREVAEEVTGNRASVWASIGVDYKKCAMNCDFCSFGQKWGLIAQESERSAEEIIELTDRFVSQGARWVTLRTTQFYGFDRLIQLIKDIRLAVTGNYEIVVNTGEFDEEKARKLAEAGAQVVYHTLRLREGKDTRFRPEDRIDTLRSVRDSPLNLAYLVEPVGIEHSNEEIADIFLKGMEYGAILSGAMARVPLPGTPFAGSDQLSERRHAQIVAVTRLAAGHHTPDICVHPPSRIAMEWGANVVVVETGAVPRDTGNCDCEWHGFDMVTARDYFENAGYVFYSGDVD
ncbi:biotin synthase [Methanolobus vulcani]|jgi:Biotin synthase and related enzymes|uniref:Biotin synthase n=1 Tax=Methanolobus vulcani TaxID=38026 RepID=A0A7Z7B097_9EURY|nr:radical SAM protein [Methanolobus vulcani]SDG04663.1 biotin synthase [Methanolobus vulcani]